MSVCDVGVLWLNAETDRVVFDVRLTREDRYFVLDGVQIRPRKGRPPTEVGRWTSKIFRCLCATVGRDSSCCAVVDDSNLYLCQGGFVFVVVCLLVCLSLSVGKFVQKLPNRFA